MCSFIDAYGGIKKLSIYILIDIWRWSRCKIHVCNIEADSFLFFLSY